MKTSRKTLGAAALVLATALWFILYRTTFFAGPEIPKGVLDEVYRDDIVVSGTMFSPLFFLPHPSGAFISVGGKTLRSPQGTMPFFGRVRGSHFRFVMDGLLSQNALYLIDDSKRTMRRVDPLDFALWDVGGEIGISAYPNIRADGYLEAGGIVRVDFRNVNRLVSIKLDVRAMQIIDRIDAQIP